MAVRKRIGEVHECCPPGSLLGGPGGWALRLTKIFLKEKSKVEETKKLKKRFPGCLPSAAAAEAVQDSSGYHDNFQNAPIQSGPIVNFSPNPIIMNREENASHPSPSPRGSAPSY